MTARERAVFTSFTAAVVAPHPHLPRTDDTDALDAFENWIAQAPRLNATVLRAALTAVDLAPLATTHRTRFSKLDDTPRGQVIDHLEHARQPPIRQAMKALKSIAFLCYYGDDAIMRTLGYDADANVARARSIRAAEGRP